MQTVLTEKVDRDSEYDKFEMKDEKDNKKQEKKQKEKAKKEKEKKLDVVVDLELTEKPKKEKKPTVKKDVKDVKVTVKKANNDVKKDSKDKLNGRHLMNVIEKNKSILAVLSETELTKEDFINALKHEISEAYDRLKKYSAQEKQALNEEQ